jgi:cation:H+ antiporter
MGLAGLFGGPFRVKVDLLEFDLPVMVGSAFVLTMMLLDGLFTTGEGVVCLVMLSVYMTVMLRNESHDDDDGRPARLKPRMWLQFAGAPVLIFAGAKYTVDAVIVISQILQIGTDVIAMSAVALGTSLPEIVVALTAARRGQPEMAVGNIVGSNIFNALAVMGIPALIGPLLIPETAFGYALPVFIGATLVHVIMTVDRHVTRGEGAFLLVLYGFFLARLFGWI